VLLSECDTYIESPLMSFDKLRMSGEIGLIGHSCKQAEGDKIRGIGTYG